MKKQFLFLVTFCIGVIALGNRPSIFDDTSSYLQSLSEYNLFEGELNKLQPSNNVIPYALNAPLFSDYASKARFIKLPEGTKIDYHNEQVFDFPIGTIIAKTFFYPKDMRNPEKGRLLMETRILLHEEKGWKALPYIWNEGQTDAMLEVAGGSKEVTWKDQKGKKRKLNYSIPNMNQCKSCHYFKDELLPIGPSARQINGDFAYETGFKNQLEHWEDLKIIDNLPTINMRPKLVDWNDERQTIEERARAYLDTNCGHCHNPDGPANTSGMYLNIHEKNPNKWGVQKAPIAAGRGSGGRQYGIVPGDPDASILVYRMASSDPGVMMPEVSRKLVHKEGVELIAKWIKEME